MDKNRKISLVKDFINCHKADDVINWQPMSEFGDNKYLTIFSKLESGEYGEVRDNAEYTEDGEITNEATEFEIEISASETKSGNPYLFEWSTVPLPSFKSMGL